MAEQIKTACPLNCFDVCGLIVTVDDDKIINIDGDKDHPITKGKICSKGRMLKERVYNSNRLLYPQKKVDGSFVRISWEQALDEISLKMLEIREKYGATSIMHSYDYSSGGLLKTLDQRFFNFFGGFTEVDGSLCWGAGVQAQYYDFGDSLSHDPEDLLNSKTIIVWGRNVTTTNLHLYPYIMEAKKNGAELIVIDPIYNNIAKQADIYLPIQPGMDGALALLVSRIIIENNWVDREFIDKYTFGFEQFKQEVLSIDVMKLYDEIKIDYLTIYSLAEKIAKQKPCTAIIGYGMQRYANGGNSIRAIDALFAISGNIGIKGGGVNYANLSVGKSFNWTSLMREDLRKEYRTFSRPTQADDIINTNNPPIKLLFITRSNPVTQLPNMNRTFEALNKVDTKIVLDMYMTDTAMLADYVLPIASVFEEEDIYYGSMFHGIVRYGPKIIDPPGEAWTDLKIWSELARRLNLEGFYESIETFLECALKPLSSSDITLSKLKTEGQISLPIAKIPWQDKKFNTSSSKFEFYSEKAKSDNLEPIVKIKYSKAYYEKEANQNIDYPYYLLSIHPLRSLHSQNHFLIHNDNDKPVITISRKISKENGLVAGDEAIIYNNRGEVKGIVKIENENNEEVVIIEEGWWKETGGSINLLTSNGASDMGRGSILYDCLVGVKKA